MGVRTFLTRLFGFGARARQPSAPAPALPAPPGARRRHRGRTAPQPVSVTRWLQKDVESAQHLAAGGDLSKAGQLYRALGRDGTIQGLLGTRTGGLVRLPKRFAGDPAAVAWLEGTEGDKGRFEAIFPDAELAVFDADAIVVGVAVAELLDVEGLDHPVFCRLDPEFLRYHAYEDRWYYASAEEGLVPITPGDGRWILDLRGGRQEPWNRGLWAALARAYVSKEHAFFLRENWNGKLANPARYARAAAGATEPERKGFLQRLIAWGVNTVFELPPGWDVGLLESNGVGYESFKETIADSNQEFMVAVAGQVVTVTGGAGFANANIHATIRTDLIQGDGKGLAGALNVQALPFVLRPHFGAARATVEWDTRPPANRKEEADSLTSAAKALEDLDRVCKTLGLPFDAKAVAARLTVPLLPPSAVPSEPAPPVVTVLDESPPANDAAPAPMDAILEDETIRTLAQKMTAAGVDRCEHGKSNRCWLCGIERVRDFETGEDGSTVWKVAWRPIQVTEVAA